STHHATSRPYPLPLPAALPIYARHKRRRELEEPDLPLQPDAGLHLHQSALSSPFPLSSGAPPCSVERLSSGARPCSTAPSSEAEIGRARLNSSHVKISYAVFCL